MVTADRLEALRVQVQEVSRLRAVYAADRENEDAFFAMLRALLQCHRAAGLLLEAVEEPQRTAAPEERREAVPATKVVKPARRNAEVVPQAVSRMAAAGLQALPGQSSGVPDIIAFQRALTRLWADCAGALAGDVE